MKRGQGMTWRGWTVIAALWLWVTALGDSGSAMLALIAFAMFAVVVLSFRRVRHMINLTALRIRHGGRAPTLAQIHALTDYGFEIFCEHLMRAEGYKAAVTPRSKDYGVDVELRHPKRGAGFVQCKRYSGSVGRPELQQLYGQMTSARAAFGFLITTGTFSREAVMWAHGKDLTLVDGELLEVMAARHFREIPRAAVATR